MDISPAIAPSPRGNASSCPPAPMRRCPYCGYSNYEYARVCRKCEVELSPSAGTVYQPEKQTLPARPAKARRLRHRGLALLLVALGVEIYWRGYTPWRVIDSPWLAALHGWAEPLLVVGGATLYVLGWILGRV